MNDAQDGKPTDGKPASGMPAGSHLPVVWSPKLGTGEGVAEEFPPPGAEHAASSSADEATSAPAGSSAPASSRQPSRFMLLAASVAIAAAVGALFGSLSASGFAYFMSGSGSKVYVSDAKTLQAVQALKVELAEFSALKANLDSATKNTNGQFAKLADRLDHVERAGAEPATKLSHIADAVDRLEKRSVAASVAPETTGSIASSAPAAPAAPTASETKVPEHVLQDWVVQDVRGNRALIASRYGGMFAVAAGGILPGLGRVETIKREDGRWVVVTGRGVITSER